MTPPALNPARFRPASRWYLATAAPADLERLARRVAVDLESGVPASQVAAGLEGDARFLAASLGLSGEDAAALVGFAADLARHVTEDLARRPTLRLVGS